MLPEYRDVLDTFLQREIPFVVTGGFAVAAHGVFKVNSGLDLALKRDSDHLNRAWEALKKAGFRCSQPMTQSEFSKPENFVKVLEENKLRTLPFFFEKKPFLFVDVLFLDTLNIDEEKDIVKVPYADLACPVLSIHKLIELKEKSESPRDQEDAKALRKVVQKRL